MTLASISTRMARTGDATFRNPQFHKLPGENVKLFSGVELEIEGAKKVDAEDRHIILDAIDEYNAKDHLWEVKGDGSLSRGLECVTHPFSFRWYQEQANFEPLFEVLAENAAPWDSRGSDRAGCHIHVSREAFDPDHLYRFSLFQYQNAELCKRISGRGTFRYGTFNISGNDRFDYQPEEVIPITPAAKTNLEAICRGRYTNNNRYQAVNFQHQGTVELRSFRSTSKLPRFKGYIEWVYALYAYTKPGRCAGTVDGFMKFLQRHAEDFPNAIALAAGDETHTPERYHKMTDAEFQEQAIAVARQYLP